MGRSPRPARRDRPGLPSAIPGPTCPAKALGLRVALERPAALQADQATNPVGPAILGGRKLLTGQMGHGSMGSDGGRAEQDRMGAHGADRPGGRHRLPVWARTVPCGTGLGDDRHPIAGSPSKQRVPASIRYATRIGHARACPSVEPSRVLMEGLHALRGRPCCYWGASVTLQ